MLNQWSSYIFYGVLSFALVVTLMPGYIFWLKHKQFGQEIRDEGPKWHQTKSGTPTMGGLIFIVSVFVLSLGFFLLTMTLSKEFLPTFIALLGFGAIGFMDDSIKVFKRQNEGFTSKQKFIAQLIISFVVTSVIYWIQPNWQFNFIFVQIAHPIILFPISIFWLVGFSNAVNLTDGIDGLSGTTTTLSFLAYFILSIWKGQDQITLIASLIIGGIIGFLIFNIKPAKIFMGDTGSLALGGVLAAMSLQLGEPFSLLLIGIIYVIETASVILQVWSFKTRGKRIFKMSPIHHHFEMSGYSEPRIVWMFASVTLVASALALILLY
ncbi:phospho-N-acetylmuramoyl-pentapeptide-transferase [Atopobacter phocae]|uniref:phospho-N-acetylmuramoyl-pentapeptide- transferase n=1 Tax=Atopobacter phocae TaxID=136492 RepID=UPI00046F08F9|nr:phospho-N-acetylmuramoyl-pentapeptide-transferase [Atopobacter phocae]